MFEDQEIIQDPIPTLPSPTEVKEQERVVATERKQAERDPVAEATKAANTMSRHEFLTSQTVPVPIEDRDNFYIDNLRNNMISGGNPNEVAPQQEVESEYRPLGSIDTSGERPLFDPRTAGGTIGNLAASFGNAVWSGVGKVATTALEAEQFLDAAGNDIQSSVDKPLYNATKGRVNALEGARESNSDGSQDAVIAAIEETFTDEERAFISPRENNQESKYAIMKEFADDAAFIDEIRAQTGKFDKYIDNGAKNEAMDEIKGDLSAAKKSYAEGQELIKNGNKVEGVLKSITAIAGLVGDTMTTVFKHPEAIAQALLESAPEMAAARANIAFGAIVSFGRTYSDNIEAFREEHGGREPEGSEHAILLMASGAEAVVSALGDKLLVGAGKGRETIKKIGKELGVKADPLKVAAKAQKVAQKAKDAATVASGRSALNNALRKTTGAITTGVVRNTKGGAQEYVEEVTESVLGQIAVKQDVDKIDLDEAHVGGAMGFASGQAMQTGVPQAVAKAATTLTKGVIHKATGKEFLSGKGKKQVREEEIAESPFEAFKVATTKEAHIKLKEVSAMEDSVEKDAATSSIKISMEEAIANPKTSVKDKEIYKRELVQLNKTQKASNAKKDLEVIKEVEEGITTPKEVDKVSVKGGFVALGQLGAQVKKNLEDATSNISKALEGFTEAQKESLVRDTEGLVKRIQDSGVTVDAEVTENISNLVKARAVALEQSKQVASPIQAKATSESVVVDKQGSGKHVSESLEVKVEKSKSTAGFTVTVATPTNKEGVKLEDNTKLTRTFDTAEEASGYASALADVDVAEQSQTKKPKKSRDSVKIVQNRKTKYDSAKTTVDKANTLANLQHTSNLEGTDTDKAFVAKEIEKLKEDGIEIESIKVGDKVNEGLKYTTAEEVSDDTLADGETVVDSIVKPQINQNGVMIQAAELKVRVGTGKGVQAQEGTTDKKADAEVVTAKLEKAASDYDANITNTKAKTESIAPVGDTQGTVQAVERILASLTPALVVEARQHTDAFRAVIRSGKPTSAVVLNKLSGSKHITTENKALLKALNNSGSPLNTVLNKTREDVASDIAEGSDGFTGLQQYLEAVTDTINARDAKGTAFLMKRLASFEAGQKYKAKTGKSRKGVDLDPDLLTKVKEEVEAIGLVTASLLSSADVVMPEVRGLLKPVSPVKTVVDKIKDAGHNIVSTVGNKVKYTNPRDKRVISGAGLTSVLNPSHTPVAGTEQQVEDFQIAMSGFGVHEDSFAQYEADNARMTMLSESKGTLTPLEVRELNDLRKSSDKLFLKMQKAAGGKKELIELMTSQGAKVGKYMPADASTDEVTKLDAVMSRGHTARTTVQKVDTREKRQNYADMMTDLTAHVNSGVSLTAAQQSVFSELPAVFRSGSDVNSLPAKYEKAVQLTNELKVPNSNIKVSNGRTAVVNPTPDGNTFGATLDNLPQDGVISNVVDYVPKLRGLLQTEDDLFTKLDAGDAALSNALINMSSSDEYNLKQITEFVMSMRTAMEKHTIIDPEGTYTQEFKGKPKKEVGNTADAQNMEGFYEFMKDGKMDSNVQDAVALALANWLQANARGTVHNTQKNIADMLGESETYTPTANERSVMTDVGVSYDLAIQSIGKDILKIMGYKLAGKGNEDAHKQLINGFGMFAIAAAQNQGNSGIFDMNYVQFSKDANKPEGQQRILKRTSKSVGVSTRFIKVVQNENQVNGERTRLKLNVENLLTAMDNDYITRDILGIESGKHRIYLEGDVMPLASEDEHNSPMQVEALDRYNQLRYKTDEEFINVVSLLSPLHRQGLVDSIPDDDNSHMDDREANQEARDEIAEQIDDMWSFYAQDENTGFGGIRFLSRSNKSNHRMTQFRGPQGGKLIRHAFKLEGSEVTLDPNDNMQMRAYGAAVLEALGEKGIDAAGNKTQDVDKATNADIERGFAAVLKDKKYKKAIAAIQSKGGLDKGNIGAIEDILGLDNVKKFNATSGTAGKLDGLLALAKFDRNAPFTVKIFKENDGITNGIAISLLQFAGASSYREYVSRLAKVGIYVNGAHGGYESFGEFMKGVDENGEPNVDSYVEFARNMTNRLANPLHPDNHFKEGTLVLPEVDINAASFLVNKDERLAFEGRESTGAKKVRSYYTVNNKTKKRNYIAKKSHNFIKKDPKTNKYVWIRKGSKPTPVFYEDKAVETKGNMIDVPNPNNPSEMVSEPASVYVKGKGKKKDKNFYKISLDQYKSMATSLSYILTQKIVVDGKAISVADEIEELSRAFAKDPLMIFNYGAGIRGLKLAIGGAIHRGVKAAIVQANKESDLAVRREAFNNIESAVNSLSFIQPMAYRKDSDGNYIDDAGRALVYDVTANAYLDKETNNPAGTRTKANAPRFTINEAAPLETPVGDDIFNMGMVAVEYTYGHTMERTFDSLYGKARASMDNIIQTSRFATQAYKTVYDNRVETQRKKTGKSYLTKEEHEDILEELLPYAPVYATHMMKGEEYNAKHGIYAPKGENSKDTNEDGTPIREGVDKVKALFGKRGNGNKTVSTISSTYSYKVLDPGVSIGALLVQSIDATVIAENMRKYNFVNIHDAAIFTLQSMLKENGEASNETFAGSEGLNDTFNDVGQNYSLGQENVKMLTRVFNHPILRNPEVRKIELAKMDFAMKNTLGVDDDSTIETILARLQQVADENDANVKTIYDRGVTVDQYASNGEGVSVVEGDSKYTSEQAAKDFKISSNEMRKNAQETRRSRFYGFLKKLKGDKNKGKREYILKDMRKVILATQYIGSSVNPRSSTYNYTEIFEKEGVANTGVYTDEDVVFVSANGVKGGLYNYYNNSEVTPVGKKVNDGQGGTEIILEGEYALLETAIDRGATIVTDTLLPNAATKTEGLAYLDSSAYNQGDKLIYEYIKSKGYIPVVTQGTIFWTPVGSALPDAAMTKAIEVESDVENTNNIPPVWELSTEEAAIEAKREEEKANRLLQAEEAKRAAHVLTTTGAWVALESYRFDIMALADSDPDAFKAFSDYLGTTEMNAIAAWIDKAIEGNYYTIPATVPADPKVLQDKADKALFSAFRSSKSTPAKAAVRKTNTKARKAGVPAESRTKKVLKALHTGLGRSSEESRLLTFMENKFKSWGEPEIVEVKSPTDMPVGMSWGDFGLFVAKPVGTTTETDKIYINTSAIALSGSPANKLRETLLHELDHAAIAVSLAADASNGKPSGSYRYLDRIYKQLSSVDTATLTPTLASIFTTLGLDNIADMDALTEPALLAELSAYGKTSPEFKAYLKAQKSDVLRVVSTDSVENSIFTRLLKVALKILGADTNDLSMYEALVGATGRYYQVDDNKSPDYSALANTKMEHTVATLRSTEYYEANPIEGVPVENMVRLGVYVGNKLREGLSLQDARKAAEAYFLKMGQKNKDGSDKSPTKDNPYVTGKKGKIDASIGAAAKLGRSKAKTEERIDPLLHATSNQHQKTTELVVSESDVMSIYNALEGKVTSGTNTVNEEHNSILLQVLSTAMPTVNKFKAAITFDSATDITAHGSSQGDNVSITVGSKAKATGTSMSPKEVFVHEIAHVFLSKIDKNSRAYKDMSTMYFKARKYLKPEHFIQEGAEHTRETLKAAKDIYNHTMNNAIAGVSGEYTTYFNANGEVFNADPVEEFVVMATTNYPLIQALNNMDESIQAGESTNTMAIRLFDNALRLFDAKVDATPNISSDTDMMALFTNLVGSETGKKNIIYKAGTAMEKGVDIVDDWLSKQASETVFGAAMRGFEQLGLGKDVGNFFRTAVHDKSIAQNDLMINIVNEFTSGRAGLEDAVKLLSKSSYAIERHGQMLQQYVSKELNEDLSDVTEIESSSIYKGVLSLDLASIYKRSGNGRLVQDYLIDDELRENQINNLITRLRVVAPTANRFMRSAAEDLGYYMTTGDRLYAFGGYTNAIQIGSMFGYIGNAGSVDKEAASEIVDELATLYAINYSKEKEPEVIERVLEVFAGDRNGIEGLETVLNMHSEITDIAREQTFKGNEYNMEKGYVKETLDSTKSITVGSAKEHRRLLALGYVKGAQVEHDPALPSKGYKEHYYINYSTKLVKYAAGAVSLSSAQTKGHDLFPVDGDRSNEELYDDLVSRETLSAGKNALIKHAMTNGGNKLKGDMRGRVAQPKFNSNGVVTGYRYSTSQHVKDTVLGRDTDYAKALSKTLAGINTRVKTDAINDEAVELAYEEYVKDFEEFPNEFVEVSLDSANGEKYKESWRLLPDAAKNKARELYGTDKVILRRNHYQVLFGFRKLSVSQLKLETGDTANAYREMLRVTNNLAYHLLNNKYGIGAEDYYQEFIKTAKDVLVIKSGVVTAGNVASNMVLLWMSGVPPLQALEDTIEAYNGILRYNQADEMIFRLQIRLNKPSLGEQEEMDIRGELNALKQEQYHNPVRELVEAGMYLTIIDDVDTAETETNIKKGFDTLVAPYVDKVPSALKNVGKNLVLTHDTKAYKVMRETAQISDFAARYSLHKHNIKNGMSFEDSISDIRTTFVNYDFPSDRTIQYANDMGLMGFTKYLFGMQQVLIKRIGEKPARAAVVAAMTAATGGVMPVPTDAIFSIDSMLNRFYSPDDWLRAMDEGLPLQLLLGAFEE